MWFCYINHVFYLYFIVNTALEQMATNKVQIHLWLEIQTRKRKENRSVILLGSFDPVISCSESLLMWINLIDGPFDAHLRNRGADINTASFPGVQYVSWTNSFRRDDPVSTSPFVWSFYIEAMQVESFINRILNVVMWFGKVILMITQLAPLICY